MITLGDFNTDLLNLSSNKTVKINNLLNGLGLMQIINFSTRIQGSTTTFLDSVIVYDNLNYKNFAIKDIPGNFDH